MCKEGSNEVEPWGWWWDHQSGGARGRVGLEARARACGGGALSGARAEHVGVLERGKGYPLLAPCTRAERAPPPQAKVVIGE